jgi:hypothetical protein
MKKDKKFDGIQLTIGSKYRIQSLESREKPLITNGIFEGYVMMGNSGEGICIELDKSHKGLAGKIRVIPLHMIISLDIISAAKFKDKEGEDSTSKYMF